MEAKDLLCYLFIYEKFAKAENKSPRTIESTVAVIRDFDRFLNSPQDINDIRPDDLRNYIRFLQSRSRWSDIPQLNHTKVYYRITPSPPIYELFARFFLGLPEKVFLTVALSRWSSPQKPRGR